MRENIVIAGGQYYRLATWPRRIAARMIDVAILASICALFGSTLLLFTVLFSIVYLFIGNGLLAGSSLGKRLMGLKVIDAKHGCPITPVQDLVRQRHLFLHSPVFAALAAFDESQGCFDKPETYVVGAKPLPPEEIEAEKEKPAKLDLVAMRKSLERPK